MSVNILETIEKPEYDFLRTNPHLGENVCHLSLGGSHAYGMNIETSDIDIRGIALNTKEEILLGRDFEQAVNEKTDTTIYSLKRFMFLLCQNNPNIVEMLGVREDQCVDFGDLKIWKGIKGLEEAVLSKRVIRAFGGYATSQLRRLENKAVRDLEDERKQNHILGSIRNAEDNFHQEFPDLPEGFLRLYVDKSPKEDRDCDIFLDANVTHCSFRDFSGYINGVSSIIRDYDKLGKRNKQAIEKGRLAKHSAHLIRLYLMCFDILEGNGVITYREKDHDLLMDIRNGKYLDEDGQPVKAFYDMVSDCEKRLDELKKTTKLREEPDMEKVNKWLMKVNEQIVNA